MENGTQRPLDTLNDLKGKKINIDLKNGKSLKGILKSFDIHINTVILDSEEITEGKVTRKLSTLFIRGDTIIFISKDG